MNSESKKDGAMTAPELTVEPWAIDRVKPYAGNPRTIPDAAVKAVADSIKRFGFRQPLVVDPQGVILCGHTRLLAARKLGLASVPVHVARYLTPDQAKALRIADNKSGEIAEWDFELLPIELSALQELDWDLTALGFSDEELAGLLGDGATTEGQTDADAVPEADETEPPVSVPGDGCWATGWRWGFPAVLRAIRDSSFRSAGIRDLRGVVWHGVVGSGTAGLGKARCGKARHGMV